MKVFLYKDELWPHFDIVDSLDYYHVTIEVTEEEKREIDAAYSAFFKVREMLRERYEENRGEL